MKLLAIEISTRHPSVALARDGIVRCLAAPAGPTTAQWLFPAVQQLFVDTKMTPGELDALALTTGPGSFTGLRIAVTAAKVLAYATGAKVVALHSLAVVAAQSGRHSADVVAVMDAQRKELFVSDVSIDEAGYPHRVSQTRIVPRQAWLSSLAPHTFITGPGLAGLTIPTGVRIADSERWYPTAETLARLAQVEFGRQNFSDLWTLAPRYVRRSYAEDKRP